MKEPPKRRCLSTREITVGAMRDVARIPGIARMIVYSVGVFALLRAAIVLFFNPALDAAGLPVNRFGTVLAVVNVAGALAAWRGHALLHRFGVRAVLVAMPVALAVMYAALIPLKIPPAAALFCIQGAAFGLYPIVTRTVLNRLVPAPEKRATTLSIESLACRLSFGPLAILGGWALEHAGLDVAMALVAGLACLPFLLVPALRKANVH